MNLRRLFCPLLLLSLPATRAESVIQLSPNGPIATPQAARDAARALPKPAKITVAPGTYALTEPLTLTAADSGVTWEASPGAKPIFSGGRTITGWTPAGNGIWKATVPGVADRKWYFEQLWVNGKRKVRARTPNAGYYNMAAPATPEMFPAAEAKVLDFECFVARPDQFLAFQQVTAAEKEDVTLIVPNTWEVHRYKLTELNPTAHAVRCRGPRLWEFLKHEPDGRYWVENFRAALDAPGEWFLSRDGTLYYLPELGEEMPQSGQNLSQSVEVIAPVSEQLLRLQEARDVKFINLTFAHSQYLTPPEGQGDPQAAVGQGAAVAIEKSNNISFLNCEVSHVANYAMWFAKGSRQGLVQHCLLTDLGAGGIKIGEFGGIPSDADLTSHITVEDSIFQHGGRLFPAGVGVLIGHASDNILRACDISDFYYSSVSIGWVWGYSPSPSKRNLVEDCHLHHLGWGMISDMGGVYTLGASEGTIIRGNHIHHVSSYRYGGWGLYTDEGSMGILMENNLVHDTSESAFHQHYGKENIIRNNILAFGGRSMLQRTRNEQHKSFTFEKNILAWRGGKLLDGTKYNWDNPLYIMRSNLYWPIDGQSFDFAGAWNWEQWKATGRDADSLLVDPLFTNIEARDFRLKPDSPALKLGFTPWDLTKAGVLPSDPAWRALAARGRDCDEGWVWRDGSSPPNKVHISAYPNWDKDSKPFPSPEFDIPLETFTMAPLGSCRLSRATVHVEGKGDSLGVTDAFDSPFPTSEPAHRPRSLRFQDNEGLQYVWDPHLSLSPKWSSGTATVTFDIIAEAGADWYCEWRDDAAPYHLGPSFWCQGGKLGVGSGGKQTISSIAPGTWLRVEISAPLGQSANGTWQVRLTPFGGQTETFSDLKCSPDWKSFDWLGWTSLANQRTAFHLDNLSVLRK